VAEALGLEGKEGSGLLEIPELANARGLREAGCLPDAGPGLSEAAAGKSAEEIRAALESGELKSLLLFGADPLRDFPDTDAWAAAIAAADHVVAFSMFENQATARADVVFPLESHAEKDGTVTHPDGRLQRVRPSASRPGDIRSNLLVLAELSAALGDDHGLAAQPTVFAALTEAVSFYSGIADSEIAGRGIRWQDRPASSSLPSAEEAGPPGTPSSLGSRPETLSPFDVVVGADSAKRSEGAPDGPAALTLGTYRDLWAGPITELNPALKFMAPQQRIELSVADAERLGLKSGDEVKVGQNGSSVLAKVAIKERVQSGVCFLIEGTAADNANGLLNGGPVAVEIAKVGS
jgi:NADH-quinone oxidoreductase subunit G